MFAVQMERELDEAGLKAADSTALSMAKDLPRHTEFQGMTVTVGSAVGPALAAAPLAAPLAGYLFQKFLADGSVESELRVERSSIIFRTSTYSRWAVVWPKARIFLHALLPVYVGQARISAIALNYVDKFFWNGSIEQCRPALLLRQGSPYVCPHVFAASDLWHSHTGLFIRHDAATKRLLNINVDCLDEKQPERPRRTVVIRSSLTDMLNQEGYDPTDLHAGMAMEFVDTHMENMHSFSKVTLRDTITDEMSQRIALES